MKNTIHTVQMNKERQITLPEEIAREASIGVSDVLGISYENGVILLKPKTKKQKTRVPIMDFLGRAKGLYGKNKEELDAYLANERASWER